MNHVKVREIIESDEKEKVKLDNFFEEKYNPELRKIIEEVNKINKKVWGNVASE